MQLSRDFCLYSFDLDPDVKCLFSLGHLRAGERHQGPIISLDWSINPQGYVQSTCDRGGLFYYGPLPAPRRETNQEIIAGLEMGSWNSKVGWPVKSLQECFDSTQHVTAASTSHSNQLIAVGDISGSISVCHFPCIDPLPGNKFGGHSHSPIAVKFQNHDKQILSAGRSDNCLIQWRHFLTPPSYDWEVSSLLDSVRLHVMSEDKVTAGDTGASMLAPLRWKPTRKVFEMATLAPSFVLELEHVYGYRGHDMKGNILFLHRKNVSPEILWSGEILYHIAGVAVIHQIYTNQQRLVQLGMKSIISQALSEDALRVVTGEAGDDPAVVVWRSSDGLIMNRFEGFHKNGVVAVCFSISESGSRIMTIGCDEFHKIAIYELSDTTATPGEKMPLAWRTGGPSDILAVGCHQVNGTDIYVTVGARHVRSWTVEKLETETKTTFELNYTKASFGQYDKYVTFTCVTFAEGLVVIGTDNGSIYFMQHNCIVKVIECAHASSGTIGVPVLDLDFVVDSSQIVSAGADGKVTFWNLNAKGEQVEVTRKEGAYDIGEISRRAKNLNQVEGSIHAFSPVPDVEIPLRVKSAKCLMTKGRDSSADEMQVLMGTRSNEIILRGSVSKKQTILMQGHLGGTVTAVAAHPSKLLFASGGSDKSLKIWDAENKMMIAMGFAEAEIMCTAWALKASASHHIATGLVGGGIAVFQYTVGRHQLTTSAIKIENHHRREGFACIKYSPDSMQIALGSVCGHLDVFDVIQGYVWTGSAHVSHKTVMSVDWSFDCRLIQACTQERKISYWDVSRKDVKTFARKSKDVTRDQVWGSWTSPIGWAVNGISWETSQVGLVKQVDVLANMKGTFDIELVKGDLDVPSLALTSTANGIHLFNFPVLPDAKAWSVTHPSTQNAATCFARDGSRVYSVGGDGICVLQWRLLSPNEVGLSGQLTRAKRAAEKTFTLLDREKFWKITRKEIDELTRRGVRSDIIRIVEPQSRELQEARLNVVDFTFEQVDMALVGRNVGGQPMILPLEANVTWNELLMLFEQFVLEKDDDGLPKMWSFMYEKFNINTKEGWTEVSEMRLRYLNPSLREAEIIKLKNESRVSFSVKTELDFRQCWHWIEHEYRWVLSFAADVPEGQRFPLSVYLIPYIKKVKKKDDGLDTGETSDAESDVDLILYARRGISKKKDGVVEEKKDEDKKKLEFAAPTGWDELGPTDVEKLDAKPQYRITFDSMHGYNGRKCRGNIGVLKEGEIVYPVGSSVVVHDRAQNKQKIFSSHEDTVMCLAVGPDRETVATATIGEDPEVLIWNGYSLALKQRFRKDHESCVVALSFSYKDNWIASVGGDDSKEMTIAVYDYVQGTTVIKEDRAGKSRIISIAFNPNVRAGEMHFVTVGVRHVRFWSLQRGKLVGRKGTYDIGRGSESMIAVAFTDPNHASAHKDVTFTGSKDGRIFIWRDAKAIYTVQSFKGPIFDLIVHGGTVVSGGKDSMAPIREWKIGRGWPTRLELTPAKGSDDQGLSVAQKAEGSGAAGRSSGGCVRALGWNGSELIVGTSSNAIHTLNPRNGVSQLLLQAHWKGAITAVAAHPSKPLVVSVGDDGAVRILNWKDKSFIQYRSLNEPATAVTVSMAYPNAFIAGMTETNGTKGEHIAVGLQSGELRILSMSLEDVNGLVRDYGTVRCQEHSTSRQGVEIWVLRYSPDGEWLALGAGDATLDLYKVSAGYLHVQSCDGHGGPVTGIDWSAQKTARGVQYIHSCSTVGRTVMNWSMTPAQDGDVKVEAINQIAVRDEPWHTWSLPLGWPVQAITGGALSSDSCATCVARSGLTGKLSSIVAVGDTSGDLSVFQFPCVSARTSAVNSVIRHFGGISALTFTSDESRLITAGQTDQMIMVSLLKPFATLSDTQEACEAGAVISPMALVRNLCSFVSVSNNLKMVAAVLSDLDVLIWEVGGLKDGAWNCSVKARLAGHSQSVNTCRFSPDDRFVASAARDKSLRLWNVDGSSAASFSGHQRDVITCSYAPNGKLVAGGDSNKTLLVWDGTGLASEALRAKAEGHRKSILCVSWSDDSRRLCTGSEDKTLRIWSVPDSVYKAGEPTTDLSVEVRLRGHTEAVVSCAFSAHESTSDKMRVCSGSMDKTVIVWHVGTGTDLCRILFDDCLLGCAFSMCSGFVGAVCLDNSVHVW